MKKYSLYEGASMETVDGHSMMLTEKGDVAVLNKTGQYVVLKLLEGTSLEEAVCLLSEEYGIDMAVANNDAVHILNELEEKHFLKACEKEQAFGE